MTNARAEIAASDVPPSFREPREPRELREPGESRADSTGPDPEPIVEAPIAGVVPAVDTGPVRESSPTGPPFALPEERGLGAASRPRPGSTLESGHVTPQRPAAAPMHGPADLSDPAGLDRGATAPQLRRFIKSRAYVPIHELRRRFGLNGNDDDVTPVDIDRTRVFVGLPDREGRLLGELLRAGDIGYELSMDPVSPIVVGVYPMRPVTRN
jgi:hypothetical protein